MPTDSVPSLIVPNGAVQLVGFILPAAISISGHRQPVRSGHAIAGLIIHEEEKTPSEIGAACARS